MYSERLFDRHRSDAFVRDDFGRVLNPNARPETIELASQLACLIAERDGQLPAWCRKPEGLVRRLRTDAFEVPHFTGVFAS